MRVNGEREGEGFFAFSVLALPVRLYYAFGLRLAVEQDGTVGERKRSFWLN